ncbi:MAG: DUF6573 family protein [Phycisphaerales bacterium]
MISQAPGTPDDEWPVIFSYTRQQAIEDGVLVDLTEWAKTEGFTIPLACTAAVWNQCIVPPAGTQDAGQSERGRSHDLMFMLYLAIRHQAKSTSGGGGGDRVMFDVQFLDAHQQLQTVQLKCLCGPGDPPEYPPVLTVLFPYED